MSDPIKNPAHYTSHPSGVQCKDIAGWHSYHIGSAIKYLWRQGLKDGNSSVQDLKKAIQHIEFEIAKIEKCSDADESNVVYELFYDGVICCLAGWSGPVRSKSRAALKIAAEQRAIASSVDVKKYYIKQVGGSEFIPYPFNMVPG